VYVLECARCAEPMLHVLQLEADYPLCTLWALRCGECSMDTGFFAWEDLEGPIRLAGDGREPEEAHTPEPAYELLDQDAVPA